MCADVVEFNGITRLDLPVDRIIARATEAGLTDVVILGFDKDGEFYSAASMADGGAMLWLLELARHRLIKIGSGEEEIAR